MKRFACGDVIPGCPHVIVGAGDQSVLDQVITHAAAVHGLTKPPIAMVELVIAHTHPFTPARSRGHLRLVAPDADLCADLGAGPPATRRAEAHETYRHECVLYDGIEGFLAAVIPFIRAGLDRKEPVMVAVIEPRLSIVRSALGPAAADVQFADMAELGQNPARIIPAWREFMDRHSGAGRPLRGVGEPIWAGRSPAEIIECQLHEALLNIAVPADTPLWLLCPYDVATLDGTVIEEAHRSHPVVVQGTKDRVSASYGGASHAGSIFEAALPAPSASSMAVTVDCLRHGHVEKVMEHARTMGLTADRTVRLATAVDGIAVAGYRETGDAGIRMWQEGAVVLCQITDGGVVTNPMVGRSTNVAGRFSRNRAIRLANELCDLVQVRSNLCGTTVRLHSSV